ncbi:MAG TPA: rubrerythrin, partial [Desulfuromonadales bacterium]|nr:rubrerythrin [Desulfuromonadales bacterium]
FVNQEPNTASSWFKALQERLMADFDERKALELAIEQEIQLEKDLRETATLIDDPKVKSVYLANADSTHHHEVIIEEQYHAMLGMSK